MIDHLLVPLPEFAESQGVLPLLHRLAVSGASDVTLLRQSMPSGFDGAAIVSESLLGAVRRFFGELRGRLFAHGVHFRTRAVLGQPADEVREGPCSSPPALIVTGGGRGTPFARFLYGSVAERVARSSSMPVLVIPVPLPGEILTDLPIGNRPVQNLLVPLDADCALHECLPTILEMARKLESRLLLVHVLPNGRRQSTRSTCEAFERGEEVLYSAGEQCARAGVPFSVLMEQGEVADRILSAAVARQADWIVLLTRSQPGGLARRPSGILRRLIRGSRLPLLAIPSGLADHDRSPSLSVKARC